MERQDHVNEIADRFWEGLLETWPILGTLVGDERFDDRMPQMTEASRAVESSLYERTLGEVRSLGRTGLDDADLATLDVVEALCTRSATHLEQRVDRLEVANHMNGPGAMLGEIASFQRADTPERLERYEARLRAFPEYLEQAAEVAREAVATGIVAPRVVAERTIAQLDRVLALPLEDSPALLPVAEDGAASKERIAALVRDVVNPAHERFRDAMRHVYLPAATETIGLSALAGGEAIYAAEILGWTSLALDPASVHELGLERLAAIQDERHELAASLGYASPVEAIAARRDSGQNTAASAAELLAMAQDQVRRCWEVAPSYFGNLPSANCEVRLVEEFREADSPFAFYNPPTEDGARPGVYYLNAFDLHDRALHHVASVTFHEANPGHHFQIALEQEMADRPAVRRFGGGAVAAAFCEGWGLYAERLADEMGLYLNDWERLGMLDNQAHRAARLVTDTGIHALEWTRGASIDALEDSGQTHTDAIIEVDRYIGMPAQALCYMIGMIEIEKARDAAKEREGANFSLQAFHDLVLANGQVPLPSFRRSFGTS